MGVVQERGPNVVVVVPPKVAGLEVGSRATASPPLTTKSPRLIVLFVVGHTTRCWCCWCWCWWCCCDSHQAGERIEVDQTGELLADGWMPKEEPMIHHHQSSRRCRRRRRRSNSGVQDLDGAGPVDVDVGLRCCNPQKCHAGRMNLLSVVPSSGKQGPHRKQRHR